MPTISSPHHTHLFCCENFADKPIVEYSPTIFQTLILLQPRTIMPRDAENFHHVLHRCITPWQKIPFFICISSTTIIYGSHVIRASPKSSHSFGTHEPSLLLGTIFLHQFVGLSLIILKFLLWTSLCFVHKLQRGNPLLNLLLISHLGLLCLHASHRF